MGDIAPVVVVAGLPELVGELRRSSDLAQVYSAKDVAEMLSLVVTELQGARPDGIVFVVDGGLPQGTSDIALDIFLAKVCGAGYRPIIVPLRGGADLPRKHPQCAELLPPLTLNTALGAIAGLGHSKVRPVADGTRPLEQMSAPQGTAPAPPAQQEAGQQGPVDAPAQGGGWSVPEQASWSAPDNAPAASTEQPLSGQPHTTQQEPAGGGRPAASSAMWTPPPTTEVSGAEPQMTAHAATTAAYVGAPGQAPTSYPDTQEQQPPAVRRTLSGLAVGGGAGATSGAPASGPWSAPVTVTPRQDSTPAAQYSRRGYVITVAVSKGGTGKSSLTLNLAAFLGMRLRSQGKTVCVIDANIQQPDAGKYLNTYVPNVNDIANDPTVLMDADPQRLLRNLIHKPEYNLSVLLGPATPDEGSPFAINADLYNSILERLRPHYDYIVIDTPVAEKFHSLFASFALPRANFIVVPVAPNLATLQNADNWLQAAVVAPPHLGGAGVDPARIGVVLNRAEEGIGLSPMEAQAEMGRWNFLGSIPETKEWKAANNRNELIAPKNYVELTQAFAQVLYHATGEQILVQSMSAGGGGKRSKGLLGRFKKEKSL